MKPHFSNQRNHALTLVEVLVVIAVFAVLAAMFLPAIVSTGHSGRQRINCVNNLKEIGLAYRLWAGDNNDKYPMFVSVTNGGAMELIATGNVAACFQVMSNELSTPKILHCPENTEHIATNSFAVLTNSNISYFVGVDARETDPQAFLSGDDNFATDDIPVKSGLVQFTTNANVTWASGRHVLYNAHFWTPANDKFWGNIGLADGSVQQLTTGGLQKSLQQTGLAIP